MAFVPALGPGCAEELGPERWETARVSGVVRLGDRPVGGGWVEFFPTDGTVGVLRSAPIGPDGRFVADGVAVGTNGVGLVGVPLPRDLRREFDTLSTPIRRTIPAGRAAPLTIDVLVEEAMLRRDEAGGGR